MKENLNTKKNSFFSFVNEPLVSFRKIIFIVAVGHLCFLITHINALLVLTNQYSGMVYFVYILIGLISLFSALRLKTVSSKGYYFSLIILIATIIIGGLLIYIYLDARANQPNLPDASKPFITRAVILSAFCAFLYLAGLVQLIRAKFLKK